MTPALVLIGHGSQDPEGNEQFHGFAQELGRQLGRPCHAGFIDHASPTMDEALEQGCRDAEALIVMPVILFAAGHVKRDIPRAVRDLQGRRPGLRILPAPPIGLHEEMTSLLQERVRLIRGARPLDDGTAVLLMGRGSSDPDANGDCVKLGRLLWERIRVPIVEVCFIGITRPGLPEGLERCVRLGAKRILVLPYLLFTGVLHKRVSRILEEFSRGHPDIEVSEAPEIGNDARLRRAVGDRIQAAESGIGRPA